MKPAEHKKLKESVRKSRMSQAMEFYYTVFNVLIQVEMARKKTKDIKVNTMINPIKKMTAKEFREMGGLQELNRCFLHPRGLALEVILEVDGSESFGGIWDCREDPEGIFFQEGAIKQDKIETFKKLYEEKKSQREKILDGKTIQVK